MTMAATTTEPSSAAAKRSRPARAEHRRRSQVRGVRAQKLSEDVFEEIEAGQRAAIRAVKRFVDTVDRTLPLQTEDPSRRQTVVDAAMEMADQLVHVQYAFLRKVVRSAGKSLSR
jgi:hypothetical protein